MTTSTTPLAPSPAIRAKAPRRDHVASTDRQTIAALLRWRAATTPDGVATIWRGDAGEHSQTWSELWRDVRSLSLRWQAAGLMPEMRIAIVAPSSRAWDLAHLAASCLGLLVIGLDDRGPDHLLHSDLQSLEPHAIIWASALRALTLPAGLRERLVLSLTIDEELAWVGRATDGRASDGVPEAPVPLTGLAAATMITTSGTTGAPKRIVYSHQQLLVACDAVHHEFGEALAGGVTISWMPLTNLFQRMLNLLAIRAGASIHYLDDPRQLVAELPRIAPTFIAGVPRLFEKLASAVDERIARLPRWRRLLTSWARRRSGQRARHGLLGPLTDVLVLRSLRQVAGPRIRFLLTGSAPTPRRVLECFASIGLPLLEAYGTSENTVPIAMNTAAAYRLGSVGRPLAPNTVVLAPDGEVLVHGPGLFHGYASENDDADTWTPDGWYRTGDIGRFDHDGYLYLTGRRRELIKTSTGRRIAPALVEAAFGEIPGLEQVVVVGDGQTHLVGLLCPTSPGTTPSRELVDRLLQVNAGLPPAHQVSAWAVLPRPLSAANGELTANGKLRRAVIMHLHATTIAALYQDHATTSTASVILRLPPTAPVLGRSP